MELRSGVIGDDEEDNRRGYRMDFFFQAEDGIRDKGM